MKRLKGGPELKMPELKVPPFLVDLYWDLRDRHLLPLVGLAIVAIVAVPFLLGGGSKQAPPPASPLAGASAAPSPESVGSKLTVVESKPGLRDYRKRLHHDSPTDPFVQRFTSPDLKGAKLAGEPESSSSTSSTSTTSTSTTEVTKTTNPDGSSTTETNGQPGSTGGPGITLFAFAIDVQITKTSGSVEGQGQGKEEKDQGQPQVKHEVIPPAALPGEKAPVVTYMGISPTTKMPFFLVSEGVSGVFGEGKCISGLGTCQLIELELGMPETFVYGPGNTRYKINVLKVKPVVTGHAPAP
ncbi:MAG TPA: hypothetical protein VJQ84_11245 [Solirubrobacterales bacterium]|nr:hypothetical protein [Solirubrobacterales bacterium]